MEPVHAASMSMQLQITSLQSEVYAMKKKAVRDGYVFAVIAVLGIITAVLK